MVAPALPPPQVPVAARKGRIWPRRPMMPGPGVDQVIDEPSMIMGMESGEPKAMLGEPTPEYPQGQPEMMTITNADGMQGAAGAPSADPEEEAMIMGLRRLLHAMGMRHPSESAAPQPYARGGRMLFSGYSPVSASSTATSRDQAAKRATLGANAAYLQAQEQVREQREQARRAMDASAEPEQTRLARESETYKYGLGGLARPKTPQELMAEQEDRADFYRQSELDRLRNAATQASLSESLAGLNDSGGGAGGGYGTPLSARSRLASPYRRYDEGGRLITLPSGAVAVNTIAARARARQAKNQGPKRYVGTPQGQMTFNEEDVAGLSDAEIASQLSQEREARAAKIAGKVAYVDPLGESATPQYLSPRQATLRKATDEERLLQAKRGFTGRLTRYGDEALLEAGFQGDIPEREMKSALMARGWRPEEIAAGIEIRTKQEERKKAEREGTDINAVSPDEQARRDAAAQKLFGKPYAQLTQQEQDQIKPWS